MDKILAQLMSLVNDRKIQSYCWDIGGKTETLRVVDANGNDSVFCEVAYKPKYKPCYDPQHGSAFIYAGMRLEILQYPPTVFNVLPRVRSSFDPPDRLGIFGSNPRWCY